jgi:hypothetical protein
MECFGFAVFAAASPPPAPPPIGDFFSLVFFAIFVLSIGRQMCAFVCVFVFQAGGRPNNNTKMNAEKFLYAARQKKAKRVICGEFSLCKSAL